MSKSVLQCINPQCGKRYNALEIRYRCDCGELLDVIHDFESFNRTGEMWRKEFKKNLQLPAFFRFKDILLPDLPEEKIVTLFEGDTPLYLANRELQRIFGIKRLYFKHEGMNPTLSFKDRGMVAGVSWANYLGVKIVACASTGDTSASMSAYAAFAGLKRVVLLPEGKISLEQLCQPISSGAIVLGLQTDFDGCMKLVQELTAKHPIYLLNSMNPFRIEGQKIIGLETISQLNWKVPDWFIIPVGNAGNISALGKGLREAYELKIIDSLPRLAGIQVEAANPLYQSYKKNFSDFKPVVAQKTTASAIQIGNPVSAKKAIREIKYFNGVFEEVSEKELLDAKAIVDSAGISICPNSATAVAGMKKLREAGVIREKDLVVVILTAHGSKFSQATIDYHKDPKSTYSNPPKTLPPTLEAIERALNL
ncbi:MAG: threonine synthase [Patescibacteria group bacterium]|nr:threonine synthase [Patescibacteria group bacterium]